MSCLLPLFCLNFLWFSADSESFYNSPSDLFRKETFTVQGSMEGKMSTNFYVSKDEYIFMECAGKVRYGAFAGEGYATGLLNPFLKGYNKTEYAGNNHGALICRIGNDAWHMERLIWDAAITEYYLESKHGIVDGIVDFIPGNYFLSTSSGKLEFELNDTWHYDNSGSFTITVYAIKKEAHFGRNQFNKCPKKEPVNEKDCKDNQWIQEDIKKSVLYHGYNDSFRGTTGMVSGCQCVYDSDLLLTSGENQGSFDIGYWLFNGDIELPEAQFQHLILDVKPHDLHKEKLGTHDMYVKPAVFCQ